MKFSQILLILFLLAFGCAVLWYFIFASSFFGVYGYISLIFYIPTILFAGVGPIYIAIRYLISIIKKEE